MTQMDRDLVNLRTSLETFMNYDSSRQLEYVKTVRNLKSKLFWELDQIGKDFSEKRTLTLDAYLELKVAYSRNLEFLDQVKESMVGLVHKTL